MNKPYYKPYYRNIIILTKFFSGGIRKFLTQLQKIKIRKVKFSVLLFKRKDRSFKKNRIKNFVYLVYRFYLNISKLNKLFRNCKYSLIITNDIYSLICVFLANIKVEKNHFYFHIFHSNFIAELNQKNFFFRIIISFFLKLALNQCKIIVSPTKTLSNYLINSYKLKNVICIPHGVKAKINIKPKILPRKNFILISIGSLSIQKDFFTIIEAVKILIFKKSFQNLKLIIIGSGELKNIYLEYIKKERLDKSILLLGFKKKVTNFLKKATLFILSTNYEGFGYVLLEAMSCGLPIISTDTPFGPREILDNGKYGILVPMKDPKAMAEAIYQLLTDEKKYQYYSKKSLERVKNFSEEKMLKRYKELFLALINNKINFCKSY